jgi:photosystem II stability/assembly factor-like uncharacterized protein
MAWLHAVYFLDHNHGWVAGSNGTLLRTIDGGASWTRVAIPRDDFRDVYFSNENVGWLLAQRDLLKLKTNERSSYLLTTNDGGVTWRRVFLNTADVNVRFARMLFIDAQHGWVFGETGVVFATSDGGAHWIPQRSATKHLLLGGAFASYRGFIAGAGATMMQSDDAGATWRLTVLHSSGTARLNAVSAFENSAWAVGEAGLIFATKDGGRSWFSQGSDVNVDLSDVKFIDAREGWAVGAQGAVLHTSDGGAHWTIDPISISHALERIFAVDRGHVWVVGFGGTILKLGETSAPRLKS